MWAHLRGRVHWFATFRAAKFKLGPAVGTARGVVGDPFAAGRAEGLAAMRAGIIPHDDDAIAGRAAMLNQWGFIVGGAAATRAIRFFCQENGLAITTHRHAAGRAEALRRVELGAARRAGDHIDAYFPSQQGMQNTHGMARHNGIDAAATLTFRLILPQFSLAKGAKGGEQGMAMRAQRRAPR